MHVVMDVMKNLCLFLMGRVPKASLKYEQEANGNRFGVCTLKAQPTRTKIIHFTTDAPWVLRDIQKAKQRLSYALPSAWSASNIRKAFTTPSSLKAHDWALLTGPLFNQAIMGLLPEAYEELFMDVSQHLHDITRKSVSYKGRSIIVNIHALLF